MPVFQVVVSDEEPQENAVKRFRREVMNTGLTFEVCSSACVTSAVV